MLLLGGVRDVIESGGAVLEDAGDVHGEDGVRGKEGDELPASPISPHSLVKVTEVVDVVEAETAAAGVLVSVVDED